MNQQEAIAFGISSARTGVDQINDPTMDDPIASYRENVIDTLNESNTGAHSINAALDAFDAEVKRLKGTEVLPGKGLNKAQAEAVYAAMCALNNVGGRVNTQMLPGPGQFGLVDAYENGVGEVLIHGSGQCEIYAGQAAFAAAYGLGA